MKYEIFWFLWISIGIVITASVVIGMLAGGIGKGNPRPESSQIIRRIGLLFVYSACLGVVFPGVVARCSSVFHVGELRERMALNRDAFGKAMATLTNGSWFSKWDTNIIGQDLPGITNAIMQYDQFKTNSASYTAKSVQLLDNYFTMASINATNPALSNVQGAVEFEQRQSDTLKKTVNLLPFYPYIFAHLNGVVPAGLLCMGILLFAMPPILPNCSSTWKAKFSWEWMLFSFFWLMAYQIPVWIRNFWPLNEGRVVYAYSNLDISPASYLTMVIVDTTFMTLVILVWAKWLTIYMDILEPEKKGLALATDSETLRTLASHYVRWQISSLLIAIPFLGYTFFYYGFMLKSHDSRYFPQALNSHLLWAITWIAISLPLIRKHNQWMLAKMEALAECHGKRSGENLKARAELFDRIRPYSAANVIASTIIGALTFIFPLIHGLWK